MVSMDPSNSSTLILDFSGTLGQGRERKTGWTLQVPLTLNPWAMGRGLHSELVHCPLPHPYPLWRHCSGSEAWKFGMGDHEYQSLCWIGQLLAEKVRIPPPSPSPLLRVRPPGPSKSLQPENTGCWALTFQDSWTHFLSLGMENLITIMF